MSAFPHIQDAPRDSIAGAVRELLDLAFANVRVPVECELCRPSDPCWYCDPNWNARVRTTANNAGSSANEDVFGDDQS